MSMSLQTELKLLSSFKDRSQVAIIAIFSPESACVSSCFRSLLRLLFLHRKNAIFSGSIIAALFPNEKYAEIRRISSTKISKRRIQTSDLGNCFVSDGKSWRRGF